MIIKRTKAGLPDKRSVKKAARVAFSYALASWEATCREIVDENRRRARRGLPKLPLPERPEFE